MVVSRGALASIWGLHEDLSNCFQAFEEMPLSQEARRELEKYSPHMAFHIIPVHKLSAKALKGVIEEMAGDLFVLFDDSERWRRKYPEF